MYDWDKDGDNDLIIHRETSPKHREIRLYFNDNLLPGTFTITQLLSTTIPGGSYHSQQLIEIGDLNTDKYPDLLISDQGPFGGTQYFEYDPTSSPLLILLHSGAFLFPKTGVVGLVPNCMMLIVRMA
ncbi:MAG: VCBS repeat-containing protein [Saprospirales bacterium]|nr:VCBS repeat-containing protein [Saprospirales bacterium]